MIRLLAIAAALLAGAVAAGAAPAVEKPTVAVAIRVDAMPFAWRDGKDGSGEFRGFLVDICREAVIRAGYLGVEQGMTAADRQKVIDDGGRVGFDLMCDPTTISLERLRKLAERTPPDELVFSPIVFVANGTFVSRRDCCRPLVAKEAAGGKAATTFVGAAYASLVAMVSSPRPAGTEPAAVGYDLPKGCFLMRGPKEVPAAKGVVIAGYITGATSRTVAARAIADRVVPDIESDWVCLREFHSHAEAVDAICRSWKRKDGSVDDSSIDLYFGDGDIIAAYRPASCNLKPAPRPLSYEPYALLVSNRTPGFREAFVRSLYELFSDGTVSNRFDTYFAGYSQSDPLKVLFRINSIPGLRK